MKKTKVLIPGLALIAFSTVASIAGSVAWFTASRTVSVNAGTYAVVKTSANLDCVASSGVGTTVDPSTPKVVSLGNNKLTDGSFNHKTGMIYQPNEAGDDLDRTVRDSTKIRGEVSVAEAKADSTLLERGDVTSGKVYSAVTFHLVFTIKFGGATGNYGLFLDCFNHTQDAGNPADTTPSHEGSTFTASTPYKTATGFRMAFYPTGSGEHGRATVFADLQDNGTWDHDDDSETAQIEKIRYVASTSNFAGTAYSSSDYDLIDSAYNTQLPTSISSSDAEARPDYLGYFAYAANSEVTLTYDVVCWFDGNDPEIHNRELETDYQSVAASLKFEAIKFSA